MFKSESKIPVELVFKSIKPGYEIEAMESYFESTLEPEIIRAIITFKETLNIDLESPPMLSHIENKEKQTMEHLIRIFFKVSENCDKKRLDSLKKMIVGIVEGDEITEFNLQETKKETKRKTFQFGRSADTLH